VDDGEDCLSVFPSTGATPALVTVLLSVVCEQIHVVVAVQFSSIYIICNKQKSSR
jgi:hypothetical protein